MIEYPSIIHSAKAPRQPCIAFEKFDGSNIRVKWTQKKGFCNFGSRTQMIDAGHPHLGGVVDYFKLHYEKQLEQIISDHWRHEREIVFFGEYFGPNSFAGFHVLTEPMKFVLFDTMIGHKNRKFLLPQEFVKIFSGTVEIPRVIYEGNLNDQLISDVRVGKYDVNEGVICKGRERTGAACGHVWMAKIKTQAYLDRLKAKFGEKEAEKYI
jgi:hypothetical protein